MSLTPAPLETASTAVVRAAVFPAPGAPVEIRSYLVPALEAGSVLLQTLADVEAGRVIKAVILPNG